jgi:hypothetical protein
MNFLQATSKYEAWLGTHLTLIAADLEIKHAEMRSALFPFFRGTYYRWAQLWPEVCNDLKSAPVALAVGDLHVENFGTWRDAEGRLIWGINDFDEVWRLPYINDLVRLGASAVIAEVRLEAAQIASAILAGYRDCLEAGGRPMVLAESHLDLRTMAVARLKDPGLYWQKLKALPVWPNEIPRMAKKALTKQMPEGELEMRISHRVAGVGSLGRHRFVALAKWRGGLIAREAKALAPSACAWAGGQKKTPGILYQEMLDCAVRCRDPFLRLRERWIVRRLAPDCSRIELTDLPHGHDESRLLYYMGRETANIHLGTVRARELQKDLGRRRGNWLEKAAARMVEAVKADWHTWRG